MSERVELRSEQKKSKTRNRKVFNLVSAVVIALVLWGYVIAEVNPTIRQAIADVPVQLLNVDSLTNRNLAISGDAEYTVDVVVEGKRSDIVKITAGEVSAEANLYGFGVGENYVTVEVTIPPTLSLVEVRSSRVVVNIEDLVAVNKPIELIYVGNIKEGYEPGAIALQPAEIQVSGARSIVETVASIQAQVPVEDLSVDGSTIRCATSPVSYGGIHVANVSLSSNYIEFYSELMKLKEVKLNVVVEGEPGEDSTLVISGPETIFVKGAKKTVDALESVETAPVPLAEVQSGVEMTLALALPEGVELANGVSEPKVTLNIEEIRRETFAFEIGDVQVENLNADESVEILPVEILVTVAGTSAAMENFQATDLRLFIDMGGLAPGTQLIPVQVRCEKDLISLMVEPAEVEAVFLSGEESAAEEGEGQEGGGAGSESGTGSEAEAGQE